MIKFILNVFSQFFILHSSFVIRSTMTLLFLLFLFLGSQSQAQISYVSASGGNWNTVTVWNPNGTPGVNDDITITNGYVINLAANQLINNITMTSGTLNINGFQLTVNGSVGGAAVANLISTSSSKLNIGGNSARFTIPAGIISLQKLTIDRANGAYSDHTLDLDGSVPADSIVLVLSNGVLELATGMEVQMKSHAIMRNITCSNSSYVDGKMVRYIKKDGGWHYFPIGDGGFSRVMAVRVGSGNINDNNENSAQFYYSTTPDYLDYDATKLPGGVLDRYYWDHTNSGANNYKRIYYTVADLPNGVDETKLVLADYNLATDDEWNIAQAVAQQAVNTVDKYAELTGANASTKRGWTFGSTSAGSPLPVSLISFTGKFEANQNTIQWKTASENDLLGYEVQRSLNGKKYEKITFIDGKNDKNMNEYSYTDNEVNYGSIYYYRLKIMDKRGKESNSNVIKVITEKTENVQLSEVYPNPISSGSNAMIDVVLPTNGWVIIRVYNMMGQLMKEVTEERSAGTYKIEVDISTLPPGTYSYSINFNLKNISGKFVRMSKTGKKEDLKDEFLEEKDEVEPFDKEK